MANKKAKPKPKQPGRPSKYKPELNEQAYRLSLLGLVDEELASFFEISVDTLNEWKKVHEGFSASIKSGKKDADGDVAKKLLERAMGYSHPDVDIRVIEGKIVKTDVIKHYPPDPTALIFWLKNRNPEKWRDKKELEHSGEQVKTYTIKPASGKGNTGE
jgi:hypothetical protein